MPAQNCDNEIRLALPKGRMFDEIVNLLAGAGIHVRASARDYRPEISLAGYNVKILKPRNVIGMLAAGARDVGFAGIDWVRETGTDLVELLDTGLNPVRLVAAAPAELLQDGDLPPRKIIVASEYRSLAEQWIAQRKLDAEVLTTYGATEVFPPDDADCIIDNTASGATLRANGLKIVDTVMTSSTRLFASRQALDDPSIRKRMDDLVLLLRSVLEARTRVMLDLNVSQQDLQRVIGQLPCMREPTISQLHNDQWLAIRAAVPRKDLAELIPRLKASGAYDIVTTTLGQIIP